MNTQMAFSASRAESWRTHCQTHPDRIATFEHLGPAECRALRLEEQLIARLCRRDHSPGTRGSALRLLAELRQCSVREVADYFAVPPAIVVGGLSLVISSGQGSAWIAKMLHSGSSVELQRSRRLRSSAA